jgi:Cd2+/Zn2+-exporting ATPase
MVARSIELPVTLRRCEGCEEDCTHCIQQRLAHRPGIRSVRVQRHPTGPAESGTLALDYDPSLLSLSQLNALLRQAGGCLSDHLAHVVLRVDGLVSPRQERPIESALSRIDGVRAIVSYTSGTVRLEFDRRHCALPEIVDRLEAMGVRLLPVDHAPPRESARGRWPAWLTLAMSSRELVFAAIGACFLLAGAIVYWTGGAGWLRGALLAFAYVLCGWHAAIDTFTTLRRLRFDIDVLMVAAATGAAALGHYEEGALLLLLFALGGAGEELAIGRARRAIAALTQIAPATAVRVEQDGRTREVRVEELQLDDRIVVQPGQRVAADGVIVAGASAVDQSPITGESVPVEKAVGDRVFAGTINGHGAVTVAVSRLAADNTLSRIIRLVEQAQSTKSPTQRFTDRIEQWYVPAVLAMTAALIVLPPLLELPSRRHPDAPWAGWFYQAMAFLTAASPCALAIGTPAAVLSGIARAARSGVLVKGGAHLENLGRVHAVAFDKTGTLTRGRPEVTDVLSVAEDHCNADEMLALAGGAERASQHPLAQAIVAYAEQRGVRRLDPVDAMQTPGLGVRAAVDGRDVVVGRVSMFDDAAASGERVAELERSGRTVVGVSVDGRVVGLIALADRARAGAREAIVALRRLGVRRTIMLTGDNAAVARAIADELGIDDVAAELMPDAKLDHVRRIDQEYGRVAMVGDGVNDAPAMANATVGIAIADPGGGSASDVALETADVVLMTDDLHRLPEAVAVARAARRIIVQNLVIALGVMAIVAPVAAVGLTSIAAAVTLHEGSTVLVVLNALRLLRKR